MRKEIEGKRMVLIADTNPNQEMIQYARSLRVKGVIILSTGGTAKCLTDNGVLVQNITLRSDAFREFGALFSVAKAESPPELSVAPELWPKKKTGLRLYLISSDGSMDPGSVLFLLRSK